MEGPDPETTMPGTHGGPGILSLIMILIFLTGAVKYRNEKHSKENSNTKMNQNKQKENKDYP